MAHSIQLETGTAEETREVGASLGQLLVPGDLVSLTGDLGAGKTTLVQGMARSLGVRDPVVSPTFTLIREYQGTVPIYHLDVYRLDRIQDVLDLGFEEMLDRDAVVFVEWGDAIDSLLPEDSVQIEMTLPDDTDLRSLTVTGRGPGWARRWRHVVAATDRWRIG
jgi:tRNA threonylcarbamoyladenosine biosynthesis protein TsaE